MTIENQIKKWTWCTKGWVLELLQQPGRNLKLNHCWCANTKSETSAPFWKFWVFLFLWFWLVLPDLWPDILSFLVIFLCSNTNRSLKSTFLTHFCHNGRFRTLFIPLSLPAMSPHQTAATFHLLYVCHIFQCHREIGKCHHPGLTHSDLLIHCRYWHSCRVTFWLVEGGGSVGWLAGIRNLLGTGRGPN